MAHTVAAAVIAVIDCVPGKPAGDTLPLPVANGNDVAVSAEPGNVLE